MPETKTWIDVREELPQLTEVVRVGHLLDEYNESDSSLFGTFVIDNEFRQSEEVFVAEQKGNDFEEDVGRLMRSGWATNCDNVTHWCRK